MEKKSGVLSAGHPIPPRPKDNSKIPDSHGCVHFETHSDWRDQSHNKELPSIQMNNSRGCVDPSCTNLSKKQKVSTLKGIPPLHPSREELKQHYSDYSQQVKQDQIIAKHLQEQEDQQMAMELQSDLAGEEEDRKIAFAHSQEGHDDMMQRSKTGRALLFTQKVLQKLQDINAQESPTTDSKINPIGTDDLFFLAERFIETWDTFHDEGKPCKVDLGYHYTSQASLDNIRTHGLLSKGDRQERQIRSNDRGSHYGDGVYTANNPFAFKRFGEVGILVARLQGHVFTTGPGRLGSGEADQFDTVVGNKRRHPWDQHRPSSEENDEVVLRSSSQSLPLLQFSSFVIAEIRGRFEPPDNPLKPYEDAMQSLVDQFFNKPAGAEDCSSTASTAAMKPSPCYPQPQPPSIDPNPLHASRAGSPIFPTFPPLNAPNDPSVAIGIPLAAGASSSPMAHSQYRTAGANVVQAPVPLKVTPSSSVTVSSVVNTTPQQIAIPSQSVYVPPVPQSVFVPSTPPQQLSAQPASWTPTPPAPRIPVRRPQRIAPHHKIRPSQRKRFAAERLDASESYKYDAPDTLTSKFDKLDDICLPRAHGNPEACPVCLDPMYPLTHPQGAWTPSCCLKKCGHSFHVVCLTQCLNTSTTCPTCRSVIGHPQGCSPSGTMTITRSPKILIDGHSTININYTLHGGIQKSYHENPGERFHTDTRRAYLPDSAEGNQLLKRLIYAFQHGLTFRVGASLTSGRKDVITWASIHHKTSTFGGVHGFPDPSYFYNCNEELDNLGVPKYPDQPGQSNPVGSNEPASPPSLFARAPQK